MKKLLTLVFALSMLLGVSMAQPQADSSAAPQKTTKAEKKAAKKAKKANKKAAKKAKKAEKSK
jgi:Ni/Co efflux regulator RcnB